MEPKMLTRNEIATTFVKDGEHYEIRRVAYDDFEPGDYTYELWGAIAGAPVGRLAGFLDYIFSVRILELETDAARRIAALEEENQDLKGNLGAAEITAKEGREIISELTSAFAVLVGEPLRSCAGGCPGHLGEKASAAAREATDRWAALERENAALRAALDEIAIPTIVEAQSRRPHEAFYAAQLRAIDRRRHGVTTPEEPR